MAETNWLAWLGPGFQVQDSVIFGKMLNLSGFQTCHCKQERLDEGDFKELKDVEVPRVGERSYRSSE